MSFAGNRDRGSVNWTYIEPQVSYNFESGLYVQCDPAITYDWTADAVNAWTIPIGADIGKVFKMGSQDLSLQIGSYDLLLSPVYHSDSSACCQNERIRGGRRRMRRSARQA